MASMPGESGGGMPEFDIDSLEIETPYYDPEEIANQAVWPLVNKLSGRDWRKKASAGQHMTMPAEGLDGSDRMFDISITADQALDIGGESETGFLSTATITVAEIVSELQRDTLVEEVSKRLPEEFEPWDLGYLVVKNCVTYAFSTDGECEIDPYLTIEEPVDGNTLWHSTSEGYHHGYDDDWAIDAEVKFRDHDLDTLKNAFIILSASAELIEPLDWIKKNPIQPDGV